eukprot:883884-Amphidinium_carterae.1
MGRLRIVHCTCPFGTSWIAAGSSQRQGFLTSQRSLENSVASGAPYLAEAPPEHLKRPETQNDPGPWSVQCQGGTKQMPQVRISVLMAYAVVKPIGGINAT